MSSILFYSIRVRKKLKNPFKIFLVSGSRIVPKNVKRGPLVVFEHPFFCKIEKNEGGPFGDFKKIAKKVLQCRKKPAQKFLVMGGTRTHVLLLGSSQKSLIKLYAKCQ